MGLLHIYCGDGKGKTSAAMGLALRMAGSRKQVVIVRFLKHEESGEVKALRLLPQIRVLPCETCFGFSWTMTEEEKQKTAQYSRMQFEQACAEAERLCEENRARAEKKPEQEASEPEPEVLLVLDELCAAVNGGFLALSAVLSFLEHRPANLEVVLTGRNPPQELLSRADYVTELVLREHPFQRGVAARRGIEY